MERLVLRTRTLALVSEAESRRSGRSRPHTSSRYGARPRQTRISISMSGTPESRSQNLPHR